MNSIQIIKHDSYYFGFLKKLSNSQLNQLTIHFDIPSEDNPDVLGGRTPAKYIDLEGIGPAVIKSYGRGGVIRHINKKWYLKLGKTRGHKEFESLINASSFGVRVPEPIVFAYTNSLFYRAWLVTKEIEKHQTLAKLSLQDEKRVVHIMGELMKQLRLIIDAGIHHVDLHPGNILITRENKIYIVDFDKAYQYKGQKASLKRKYIHRWQRAVDKHGLPKMLADRLRDGL